MSDRDCPYCNHTSDSHCGDVADQIRANGGTPGNGICSNAQVYGMRAKTERPGSWDQRAFTTAQAILAIEGNDRGQLSARVQLAVLDAMQWAAPVASAEPPTQAATDVLGERRRQIHVHGWTPEHDDTHDAGDLAAAAASFALLWGNPATAVRVYPWGCGGPERGPQRSNLVKAGALILAEIERLDRSKKGASA